MDKSRKGELQQVMEDAESKTFLESSLCLMTVMKIWLKTPSFRKVIGVYFVLQKNLLSLRVKTLLHISG